MPFYLISSTIATILLAPALFAFAGGIRFITTSAPSIALVLALPLFIFFCQRLLPKVRFQNKSQIILCLLTFFYSLFRLYNPDLGALVSYGCADAANHLFLYKAFSKNNYEVYEGFNALYMNWWLFENVFRLDIITALIFALSVPLFSISYLIAFFAPKMELNKGSILKSITYISALVIFAECLILPSLHYNQADGYLAHLYSIAIFLIAIFFADKLDIFGFIFLIVAIRFTYGLQIPEFIVAGSFLFAIQSVNSTSKFPRLAKGAFSLALLALAALVISKLMQAFSASGSIISQNLDSAFAAQIVGIALLITSREKRSFEIWFLLSTSLIQGFWLLTTSESDYYFSKLFLYSSLCLTIIALRELPSLLNSKILIRSITWIMLVSFLSLAQKPYLASYFERSLSNASYRLIAPLFDQKIKRIVEKVLAEEKKDFAGYYTSRWAQYAFFNKYYDKAGSLDSFYEPPKTLAKNSCIFWSDNANDIPRLEKYPAPKTIEWFKEINQRKDAKIIKYQVEWAGRQVIKYLCSDEQELVISTYS